VPIFWGKNTQGIAIRAIKGRSGLFIISKFLGNNKINVEGIVIRAHQRSGSFVVSKLFGFNKIYVVHSMVR